MSPELDRQLPTLRSQMAWLFAMLLAYLLIAPRFGNCAPFQRVLLNALSLGAWLFLLVAVFVPLERLFSLRRQPTLRPNLLVDLGYYFLTGLIPTLVLAVPIALLAATARSMVPTGYLFWVASLPVGVKIVGALMIGELGYYWAYRAMHEIPALWKFHAVHHQPVRMDWLINSRAHPIDIIFTRMCGLALVAVSGFGSAGAAGTGRGTYEIVLFFSIFWAFVIHANVNWRFGPLEHVLSSPRFHHWHHSRDDHPNHNYASMLPFYDRIFGTHHLPARAWPPTYGIAPENSPEALVAAAQEPRAEAKERI